ncbi:MAG: O-antigen ligase family protein [Patescibacteria group bacterium]|jgi:O-antigen ligase
MSVATSKTSTIVYFIMAAFYLSVFILANTVIGFNIYLYLFCLVGAGVFIYLKPVVGLYLIVFLTMIFERFFTLTPIIVNRATYKFYPLDLLLLITLAIVFIKKPLAARWLPLYQANKKLFWSLGIFFLILLANLIRAVVVQGDLDNAISVVKNYMFYSLVYLITIQLINTATRYQELLQVMLLATLVILVIFLFGLITGQGVLTQFIPLSTYGTRYLGGSHSFYITIIIILLFSHLVYEQRMVKSWPLFLHGLVLLFCLLALVLSLLRHLWLGVFLGLFFMALVYPVKQKIKLGKILGTVALVALLGFGSLVVVNKWQQATGLATSDVLSSLTIRAQSIIQFNFTDESAVWRTESWKAALQIWTKQPVFGLGIVNKITVELFGWQSEILPRDLHNDFVAILLQTGIIGLLAWWWFILEISKWFVQQFRQVSISEKKQLIEITAIIGLFLFSANFGTYFDINLLVIFFWLFLGLQHNYSSITKA